ncbi:alpha/beta fold hydrolase [Haliscomenobacter sp.]|uniref:alpha/beta hydrolase family protein n=1 Tax=Haliscomenobacter sp. TaxID=2717303 RepID=UPI003364F8BC
MMNPIPTSNQPKTSSEKLSITCADGVTLAAILCVPNEPKAALMLSGGTAFKKEFYLPIAHFLAEHGFATVVYDYRGTCESAPATMRHCNYSYLDYGQQDMPAVLNYLDTRFPALPKLIFGHSVGGLKVGLMPNLHLVKGMVCFATSVGYLPYMPWSYRLKSYYFFYLFAPLSIALWGYVAAKRFRIMEDLPGRIVMQWRAWCGKPDHYFDPKFYGKTVPIGAYDQIPFPIHVFWASDDPISNARSVPRFWQHVKSQAGIGFTQWRPEDWNVKKIEHHGLFKSQFKKSLWLEILGALQRML